MKEEKQISLPVSWLERLLKLSERCRDEKDKTGMWILIGYISSVETLLKYKSLPKKENLDTTQN